MASNEVTLRGYVRKIELRFAAQSGKAFLSIAVPVDRRRFNKQTQEWETENTTWWNLTTVGADAEYQAENLKEGDEITFTGLPELEKREGKDGKTYTNAVMKFPLIAKVVRAPKDYQGGAPAGGGFGGQQQGGFGGGQQGFGGPSQPPAWEQDDNTPPF